MIDAGQGMFDMKEVYCYWRVSLTYLSISVSFCGYSS